MKYSQWIGILAATTLIASCFLPWAWYPDLNENFTGFYTHENNYGKPGKIFVFLSAIAVVLFLVPRVWAKRTNIFLCALILAYALKSFILFGSCYAGICPEKKLGLWLMLISCVLLMVMAFFPGYKLKAGVSPNDH